MPSTDAVRRRLAELSKLIAESEDVDAVIKWRRDQDKLLDRMASTASGGSTR